LVLFSGLGHCITFGLSDYTYAENATEIADHEASRLSYVKIGVAIGMFAITAGACSLPVIVITCITRRICSHHSGSRSSALNPPSYTLGVSHLYLFLLVYHFIYYHYEFVHLHSLEEVLVCRARDFVLESCSLTYIRGHSEIECLQCTFISHAFERALDKLNFSI
uniref:H(+)-exporting diphosphatase n=1 Tax=Hymenolepis diminuta TaxID=6216 RepID=A0A0R3SNC5_HYMDI